MSADVSNSRIFDALGTLLLAPRDYASPEGMWFARDLEYVSKLSPEQFTDFLAQAEKQRVLRRVLEVLQAHLHKTNRERTIAQIVESALAKEEDRLRTCLTCLDQIVGRFERCGH